MPSVRALGCDDRPAGAGARPESHVPLSCCCPPRAASPVGIDDVVRQSFARPSFDRACLTQAGVSSFFSWSLLNLSHMCRSHPTECGQEAYGDTHHDSRSYIDVRSQMSSHPRGANSSGANLKSGSRAKGQTWTARTPVAARWQSPDKRASQGRICD